MTTQLQRAAAKLELLLNGDTREPTETPDKQRYASQVGRAGWVSPAPLNSS